MDADDLRAVCLCAGWCATCRDWLPMTREVAREHPGVRWRWLDIEDEAERLGDLDIETLPCLLLARGAQVLFFGPVLPQAEVLSRLVRTFTAPGARPAGAVDGAAAAFWQRLRAAG